ncbi:MAG: monovalent cation/H+ antiporter subunit D [Burkholderiales bacterium]
MNHWIIAPIALPFATALLTMLPMGLTAQRVISLGSALLLAVISIGLIGLAGGEADVYALGAWPAPYGIVLVLDRLSAMMVALTAFCGLAALMHAVSGWDARGRDFHPLFQFQLAGLCGAFLTGDLFNLFVFFELMLIASYCLLQHGAGASRRAAGIQYVVLNLTGSTLFLVAVALIYGALGTLNLADLAVKVSAIEPHQVPAVRAAALILMVVFALKAAILPLYFWLPSTYGAAAAPVAAIFVVLSKVGVYAILRLHGMVFGADAGALAHAADAWLLPAALATVAIGGIGALGASTLRELSGYLAIGSSGLVLVSASLGTPEGMQAGQFYLLHSVISVSALFLLADAISAFRGDDGDRIVRARAIEKPMFYGILYFLIAIAAAGLPPLAGFMGKAMVLSAAVHAPGTGWVFAVVLIASLLNLLALARAGIQIFWHCAGEAAIPSRESWRKGVSAAAFLTAVTVALAVAAGPVARYAGYSAAQQASAYEYGGELLRKGMQVNR